MNYADRGKYGGLLEQQCIAHDIDLRPGRAELYWQALQRFSFDVVAEASGRLLSTCKRFPTIAEWVAECQACVSRRARVNQQSTGEPAAEPATWTTAAYRVLIFAGFAGLRVGDERTRDRALSVIHDELVTLREEYTRPGDCPRERWTSERKRIVSVVLEHHRRGELGPAAGETSGANAGAGQ